MKKIILILLIFVSSVLSAEMVYVMSRKDYYDLCATISAYKTDYQTGIKYQFYHITSLIQDLENIKNKLEAKEKSTFSNDMEVLISSVSCLRYSIPAKTHRQFEIITDILEGLQKYDDKRYYSGANSRLDRKLTTDEKLSILGGRIDLLEMRLLKMEGLIK